MDFGLVLGDGTHSALIELMGVKRATYAMWMCDPIPAGRVLEYATPDDVEAAWREEIARRIRCQYGTVCRPKEFTGAGTCRLIAGG
jgi:enoyl-CoA hydratase/carnithine racemase